MYDQAQVKLSSVDTAQIQLQMTYKNMFNLGYDSIYTSYFVTL